MHLLGALLSSATRHCPKQAGDALRFARNMALVLGKRVDCVWIAKKARSARAGPRGVIGALEAELGKVRGERRRPYMGPERPGPRFLVKLLPSWWLFIASVGVGLALVAMAWALGALGGLSEARERASMLLLVTAPILTIALPLIAAFGQFRRQDEYLTAYLWDTTRLRLFVVFTAAAFLASLLGWLVGTLGPSGASATLLRDGMLSRQAKAAAMPCWVLTAIALGLTVGAVLALTGLLLEFALFSQRRALAAAAGRHYESLTVVASCLEKARRALGGDPGLMREGEGEPWRAGLESRVRRSLRDGNEQALSLVLRAVLVDSLLNALGRMRGAGVAWSPPIADLMHRGFRAFHYRLLELILHQSTMGEGLPPGWLLSFVEVLQARYTEGIWELAREGHAGPLDLYLHELPHLYRLQTQWAREHMDARWPEARRQLEEGRALWAHPFAPRELPSLVRRLPGNAAPDTRADLLSLFHAAGVRFLRMARDLNDSDVVTEMAESLAKLCDMANSTVPTENQP